MANQLNKVPTSLEPIAKFGDANVPTMVTREWYLFFQSLALILGNLVGGVLGFTTETGVTATGTTQGTAVVMTTEWIEVTTTPLNSGVMLQNFGPGVPSTVFNEGANSLKIYPSVGSQIDALGANAPYPLPAGKMQTFFQTANTQFRSTQLG
jgi:hypothetical protein